MQSEIEVPGVGEDLVLTPFGYQIGKHCGYCGAEERQYFPISRTVTSDFPNLCYSQRLILRLDLLQQPLTDPWAVASTIVGASYYIKAIRVSVENYQELIDRGWRRSGKLLYKPNVKHSCCPHYTIRLKADDFKPRKDQRQALNRWTHFVLGTAYMEGEQNFLPQRIRTSPQNSFSLYQSVHRCEADQTERTLKPRLLFDVTIEPPDFTTEKFQLYANYQHMVHKDPLGDITPEGFKGFLCDTPLVTSKPENQPGGGGKLLGSFHQCYRLNGRLIAMSVLDLLPNAVSGVYFIYHSDFEKWSFGKLSALREICLAREGQYNYYYMGYYIHNCAKMRYKGDYSPQYILDPESHTWDRLDDAFRARLDTTKYISVSAERRRLAAAAQEPSTSESESTTATSQDDTAMPDADNDTPTDPDGDPDGDPDSDPDSDPDTQPVGSNIDSVFTADMPGVLTRADLAALARGPDPFVVRAIPLRVTGGMLLRADYVVKFQSDRRLLHALEELAAVLGERLARRCVVSFWEPS